ncbi:retroviral-like aspartic protease family protein [Bacteroidales bacterium OttesenSCG-928-B11]|nr:retroviral-like aspartic protease family protein [Bacteroidales bacterium OttesenSCG-928-C03]MDL2312926.1 retroviral-like aspartic protease family protein [Bacteroidales bacterium OttesenSCG-928-B11]MDL2325538.1 retroviral-like aspartic protease family protein [Bacteroidales bacterium OttesenSCG-928-A14]
MKHYTVKLQTVKLESGSYHITAKAKIGKTPVNLVVDTGASHSCFDLKFIKRLNHKIESDSAGNNDLNVGLGEVGFESKITYLQDFEIGGLKVEDYMVALLDLTHVNKTYHFLGKPKVHGLLGCDFLIRYMAVIDYMKGEMTLWCKD